MLILPPEIMQVLRPFAQAFSARIWDWVQVLIVGAILSPGKRTVTAVLRVMGLRDEPQFQNYHRVLNRATRSGVRAGLLRSSQLSHQGTQMAAAVCPSPR